MCPGKAGSERFRRLLSSSLLAFLSISESGERNRRCRLRRKVLYRMHVIRQFVLLRKVYASSMLLWRRRFPV